jgi:hypothetical protein
LITDAIWTIAISKAIPNIIAGIGVGPLAGKKYGIVVTYVEIRSRSDDRKVVGVMKIDYLSHGAGGQKCWNNC